MSDPATKSGWVIHYDLPEVSPEVIAMARGLAPISGETAPASTVWPDGIRPPEHLLDHRDPRWLDQVMELVDGVITRLHGSPLGTSLAARHGVSLPEVARYRILFALAEPLRRLADLAEICQRWSPSTVLWVAPRGKRMPELDAYGRQKQVSPQLRILRSGHAPVFAGLREMAYCQVEKAREVAHRLRLRARLGSWGPAQTAGVVLTEYFPNSCRTILPIARQLREHHGLSPCWLAARPKVEGVLALVGEPFEELARFSSVRLLSERGLGATERRELQRAIQSLPQNLLVGLGGQRAVNELVETVTGVALAEAARWVTAYEDAWRNLSPNVVLSTSYSSIPGRAAALTAQRRGARAAYVQHGLLPARRCYAYFCHDLIMVWGNATAEGLIVHGVPRERLRVVGGLARGVTGSGATRPWRPLTGPFSVAFMASRTGGAVSSTAASRKTLLAVAQAVTSMEGSRLVVKAHPSDNATLLHDVINAFPRATLVTAGSASAVISQADVVVIASSTTGLEACGAGKPVIIVNFTGMPDQTGLADYGAAILAQTNEELAEALSAVRFDETVGWRLEEGRRRVLDEYLGAGVKDPVAEVASLVAGLVGPKLPSAAESRLG